jgi:hypothetical protein
MPSSAERRHPPTWPSQATGVLDIGAIIQQIVGGGVGGGILMVIVGIIKQLMGGTKHA